jgi:hypothetical protein
MAGGFSYNNERGKQAFGKAQNATKNTNKSWREEREKGGEREREIPNDVTF